MSDGSTEPTLSERLNERPSAGPQEVGQVKPRDLLVRFMAGALTSICSGAATLAFGARPAGILLAFPAILAASLTLIEEQEDSVEAREDARGAIAGGVALTIFAVVAAVTLGHLSGALALLIATASWAAVALSIYVLAWWPKRSRP